MCPIFVRTHFLTENKKIFLPTAPRLFKVPKSWILLHFEVPEIHLLFAKPKFYNHVEKTRKKLQNIIFEHVRNVSVNVSMNMSPKTKRTCPKNLDERVRNMSGPISTVRVPNVSENLSKSMGRRLNSKIYTNTMNIGLLGTMPRNVSRKTSMNVSTTCPRNSFKRVRVRVREHVPEIPSNVSTNVSANVSANVSGSDPKIWQKIENIEFFNEKMRYGVANALHNKSHS